MEESGVKHGCVVCLKHPGITDDDDFQNPDWLNQLPTYGVGISHHYSFTHRTRHFRKGITVSSAKEVHTRKVYLILKFRK